MTRRRQHIFLNIFLNKWSKNFDDWPHRMSAIIADWINPFAAYTAAETPNAFQMTTHWYDTFILDNKWQTQNVMA